MSKINILKNAITSAINDGLLADHNNLLTGYSGAKMVGMLQRLAKETLNENTCYLEVGVFKGLTLLSVAKELDNAQAYGIDNFAFFDKKGENLSIVNERIKKLNITNANIINKDYEDALENLDKEIGSKKVGVYFIDGPHDYRSQLMCLLLIKPFLAKDAIIIIDDSNYRHVRQANRDFLIANPDFKLAFQSYTKAHPANLNDKDRKESENSWWNGVNVIVHDSNNELETCYPPTLRNRSLYENDHTIHAAKHPEIIPALLKLTNLLAPIGKVLTKKNHFIEGKYPLLNTYSENLPQNDFNQALK